MVIGFNTSKTEAISLSEKIKIFLEEGCNAIEFSMMNLEREEQLAQSWEVIPWSKFAYKSLHAPVQDFVYQDNKTTHDLLGRIKALHDKYSFDLIVFHPDTVEDWSVFKDYDFPIAFENMDNRKKVAKDVGGLKDVFSLVNASMVLDLNHCYTNDPTMALADDFYRNFKDRIKEIHLSGYDTFHDPLYQTRQVEIIEAIPNKDIPIIIESGQNTVEDIRNEFRYIMNILNK